MDKNAVWKWLILFIVVGSSLYLVTPPKDKIRLGLDLQGGSSFTLRIDEQKIREKVAENFQTMPEGTEEEKAAKASTVEAETRKMLQGAQDRALEVIRNRVDGLGISEPVIYPMTSGSNSLLVVQLPGVDKAKREEAENSITSVAYLQFKMVAEKSQQMVRELFDKNLAPPGYTIATDMLQPNDYLYAIDPSYTGKRDRTYREETLGKFYAPGKEDSSYEFMLEKVKRQNRDLYKPYYVERRAKLEGDQLKSAKVDMNGYGEQVVALEFHPKGARTFWRITSDYAPGGEQNAERKERFLAIVMDGTLYSAPFLKEPIPGGRGVISGSFTPQEAGFLANVLNAGSLSAPVEIIERRIVDPTLGKDSIRSGISASIYGCLAIVVLMAGYYLVNGLLADMALMLNVILLPLGMILAAGFLDAVTGAGGLAGKIALPVLTLPGIAGIALSIGMAVDANVLIAERIREENAAGKGLMGAIQAGYERAFTAIFDSNITTIVTAVILFILGGSGPIRGYAITLIGGLVVSLYTAVVVTRMVYNLIAARRTDSRILKMNQLFKATNINFMGVWKIPLGISVVLIVVSWGLMVWNGLKDKTTVFGVDFTGGSALTLGFEKKCEVDQIRKAIGDAGVPDATIQYKGSLGGDDAAAAGEDELQIKVANMEQGKLVEEALVKAFPDAGLVVKQRDDVGPQVSRGLMTRAMWALLASLAAIIIYIGIRFEMGFGIGAVVAVFHDVLITAGLCHLFGIQMSMTVVAALLTIIGYSVNDTIVIFDRIREDLRLVRNKSFIDICNLAMNQTLSRTILTNFLTFVSVLCLLVFGGGAIKDFSATMFIGMIAGTYSTIYIATPIVLIWYKFKTPELGSKPAK